MNVTWELRDTIFLVSFQFFKLYYCVINQQMTFGNAWTEHRGTSSGYREHWHYIGQNVSNIWPQHSGLPKFFLTLGLFLGQDSYVTQNPHWWLLLKTFPAKWPPCRMGIQFRHCFLGTAAAFCCWMMTDLLLVLLFPALFSVFISLFWKSVTSSFFTFYLCLTPRSTNTHNDTNTHKGSLLSENKFPGILVQGILMKAFHISAL